MFKVGVLGATGPAGRGIVSRLASVGLRVYAGSRDQAKAEATVKQLQDQWGHRMARIEPVHNSEAAKLAEIVVLGTTAAATVATAAEYAEDLAGKPVVSMASSMAKVGASFRYVPTQEGSIAAAVQQAAPEALVAAALHHVPAAAFANLERPMVGDVVVVSDHLEALRATEALVSAMPDLRALDGGSLENALGLESFTAVILTVNLRYGGRATLQLMPS
ncbi:MAG: NADPH-dependent F420 reductase [Actinomycetota bacterium]|nr:NADPH-dependent F420 reductase [Actinomycetota bacterium]